MLPRPLRWKRPISDTSELAPRSPQPSSGLRAPNTDDPGWRTTRTLTLGTRTTGEASGTTQAAATTTAEAEEEEGGKVATTSSGTTTELAEDLASVAVARLPSPL